MLFGMNLMKKLFTRIILHFSNPIKALKLDIVYFYSLYSKLMLKVIYKIKIPINDNFYKIDYSSFNNSYSILFRSCESSFIISYNVFRSNHLWNFYCPVSSFWTLETLLQSIIKLCFKV